MQTLPDTAGKLNDVFESVAANGLKSLTDGITDAITGAKSLGDVFHNVAKQIIADLVKIAIERALSDGLTAAAGSSNSTIASIGKFLAPRASGGHVNGGQMYRINESGSPGNVEGFVPQGSGTVIPLGRMSAAMGGGGSTRVFNISVSADHSVTPAGFAKGLAAHILQEAQRMDAQTFAAGQKAAPARIQKQQTLGT
jgi:hypothetical protein